MEALAVDRRREANAAWFAGEAERLARLCGEMAERFARGGRLLATGGGGYNRRNLALAWTAVVESFVAAGQAA